MLEEWALCGTPAACLLVVPGCRMLTSLATTKGALALWAGKEAGLTGILEGGIPKPFSDQVEFRAETRAGRGWSVLGSNEGGFW